MEIERLRKLILEGRYEVPAEKVAEAIITWYDPMAIESRPVDKVTPARPPAGSTPTGHAPEPPVGPGPGPPRP